MLASFAELLVEHESRGTALGAFTCYDLEVARGVLAAAAARNTGVVLLVSREAFAAPGGDGLLAGIRVAAECSPARATVQLDHVADLGLIEAAFELGAGAVMADGSKLPFEENANLVLGAQRLAERVGGAVEAELGHVAGGEDVAVATKAGGFTDPAEAAKLVAMTELACLAVSIRNVHGVLATEPELDFGVLSDVLGAVEVPLSLHGASGLPDAMVRRAMAGGIRKVNVNTELREAYLHATTARIVEFTEGLRVLALHDAQVAAVRAVVEAKLDLFSGV